MRRVRKAAYKVVVVVVLVAMVSAASGCAVLNEGWQRLKDLVDGNGQQTETVDPDSSADDTGELIDEETSMTTEPPEGEEFVKVSRKLDPLLWEVGEKLYYINPDTATLRYRYDVEADNEVVGNTGGDGNTQSDDGSGMVTVDEAIADEVSAIAGFSQERIFCLSSPMYDDSGRVVYDVVAIDYEGNEREIVALQVNSAAVIDNNWLLASRFGSSESIGDSGDKSNSGAAEAGVDTGGDSSRSAGSTGVVAGGNEQAGDEQESASLEGDQTSGLAEKDTLRLLVLNLKKDEEIVVFTDDGNVYPGMDHVDAAIGTNFVHEDDGIRVEISYPGYSEYPYVRYLLFAEGEIIQDSEVAPWQDNLGQYLFNDGMVELLQEVKIYNDLAIYEQRNDSLTSLVYDHPDKTYDILRDSRYHVFDFFYHQGYVLVQVYDPDAGMDGAQIKKIIFNPADESLIDTDNNYDSFYQYQDRLAGLRVEASGEGLTNNIEARFVVDLIDGQGKATQELFNQVLKTGTAYGEPTFFAWRAGHDLVIRYETHIPETGTISETSTNWLFIKLTGG